MNATAQAIVELKKVIDTEDSPLIGIRITSEQGCCGPSLKMAVVEKPAAGDQQVSIDALNFYLDDQAMDSMKEVTIDYGPNGFKFNNLKKSGSCCS